MARDTGKKYRATFGICVACEKIFPDGKYSRADGLIFCGPCKETYEADTTPGKQRKYA